MEDMTNLDEVVSVGTVAFCFVFESTSERFAFVIRMHAYKHITNTANVPTCLYH